MKRWIVYCDSETDPEYKRGDMISETGEASGLAPAHVLKAKGRVAVEVEIPNPDPEEQRTGQVNYARRRWDPTRKTLVTHGD